MQKETDYIGDVPASDIAIECVCDMGNKMWTWEDWWEQFGHNGKVPTRKTYKYQKWIQDRNLLKGNINREYMRNKDPYRLECIGVGRGIYLLDKDNVCQVTMPKCLKKTVSQTENYSTMFSQIAEAKGIDPKDKRIANNMAAFFSTQHQSVIGAVHLMRLSAAMKKSILKKLGVSPPQ